MEALNPTTLSWLQFYWHNSVIVVWRFKTVVELKVSLQLINVSMWLVSCTSYQECGCFLLEWITSQNKKITIIPELNEHREKSMYTYQQVVGGLKGIECNGCSKTHPFCWVMSTFVWPPFSLSRYFHLGIFSYLSNSMCVLRNWANSPQMEQHYQHRHQDIEHPGFPTLQL